MAPFVPSLRVQRLEELQRQQSIDLQQMLLRRPKSCPSSPRPRYKPPQLAPSVVAPVAPNTPRRMSQPSPSGRTTPVPSPWTPLTTPRRVRKRSPHSPPPEQKVQGVLKLIDSVPVLSPKDFGSLKAARAGVLRLAQELAGVQQRRRAQEKLQEELQLSLARHGGDTLKRRLHEERLVYEDHIQTLSAADRERRADPAGRFEQSQSFADRLESQAEDFRLHYQHVKEVRALDASIKEDQDVQQRLASLEKIVEARRAELKLQSEAVNEAQDQGVRHQLS